MKEGPGTDPGPFLPVPGICPSQTFTQAFAVSQFDTLTHVLGILYGAVLIMATFVRSGFTEAMRIDALFIKNAGEQTRPLNLIAGLLFAGYGIYSLLSK